MKILLTGYGPFRKKDGREVRENISVKIIQEILKGQKEKGQQIKGVILPVEWQAAEEIFERHFFDYLPDLVVSMGHAAGYQDLTLEKRYFNIARGMDNKKREHKKGIIKPDGDDFYLTNINISKLRDCLNGKKIPVKIHDGGKGMDFLCNFAGYLSAYHCRKKNLKAKYLFIHVPSLEDVSYSVSFSGIKAVIDFMAEIEKKGKKKEKLDISDDLQ
jgi:pyroglutamyl-peptidase